MVRRGGYRKLSPALITIAIILEYTRRPCESHVTTRKSSVADLATGYCRETLDCGNPLLVDGVFPELGRTEMQPGWSPKRSGFAVYEARA